MLSVDRKSGIKVGVLKPASDTILNDGHTIERRAPSEMESVKGIETKRGSVSTAPVVEIQGRQLKLSNLDKVLYPATGFTKGQVIDYYAHIAPVLVPHLAGRPLTLKRYPNGVDSQYFFEKNATAHRPDWVKTAPIWSEGNSRTVNYILANDLSTMVWMANLAAIELHPSLSLAKEIECPTMMVFDLDPGPPANIVQCAQVGMWLREIFEHFGLQSFPKTSGSKGLQIYVPLNTPTSYEVTKTICPRAGPAAGGPASRPGGFRHEEGVAQRQSAGGLEPERPAQDDDCGVFAAGARASHGFDAGEVGRSRAHAQEERRDLCWCSKPSRSSSAWKKWETCSSRRSR